MKPGWHIFPCVPGEKRPLTENGVHDATADPAQIAAWQKQWPEANWAVACGPSGLAVVDIDGPEGEASWAEFECVHGLAPDTLIVRTPSGGRHIYFEGAARNSAGTLGKHLDVRGEGGYVLLPGSVVNGNMYEPIAYAAGPIAALPYDLNPPKRERKTAVVSELDTPAAIRRAKEVVAKAPVVSEGSRNDTAYRLGAELCDVGVSVNIAYEFAARWNDELSDPLDHDELELAVWSGFTNRENDPACYAPDDKRLTNFAADKTDGGPVPFRYVLDRQVPPVQELISGLVERGTVTFLAGPGGTHKSRVALQWGLAIDQGMPIWGRATQQASFLYLSYEDHADEVARRAQRIAQRIGLEPDANPGRYWDLTAERPKLATIPDGGAPIIEPFMDALKQHLATIPGHHFILIDSTYNALAFEGSAKINEGSVMGAIGLLQNLCDETDSTILILWHPSKAGQESGDASGWSVAWHNAPRSRLSLTAVKDSEDAFDLKVEKRNHGARGKPLTLHWSDGVLLPMAEAETGEARAILMRAAVRVATLAAKQGAPVTIQKALTTWQLDMMEERLGRRPSQPMAKEAMADAMRAGLLRYRNWSRGVPAGYVPVSQPSDGQSVGPGGDTGHVQEGQQTPSDPLAPLPLDGQRDPDGIPGNDDLGEGRGQPKDAEPVLPAQSPEDGETPA